MNNTATVNSELAIETGMCLWEEVLENKELYEDALGFEEYGTGQVRMSVRGLVAKCDEAYALATARGYDNPFDWEFCPAYLRYYLIEGCRDAKDIATRIMADYDAAEEANTYEGEIEGFVYYPCKEEDGCVTKCPYYDATFYGIYCRNTATGELAHITDRPTAHDARECIRLLLTAANSNQPKG